MFNHGSPWNVVAGQGSADLTQLVSHYEAKHKKIEESRIGRMRDGKVVTIYEDWAIPATPNDAAPPATSSLPVARAEQGARDDLGMKGRK